MSEITEAIARFKQLRQLGYPTDALSKLFEVAELAEHDPTLSAEEIRKWAQFLFFVGDEHKKYAEGGASGTVRPGYPAKAREVFFIYLDWYGALSDEQRGYLSKTDKTDKVDRTLIVTAFIGQLFNAEKNYNDAIVRYESYARQHIAWLGLDAIDIWESALNHGSIARSDPAHWQAYVEAITQLLDAPSPDRNLDQGDRENLNRRLDNAKQDHRASPAKQAKNADGEARSKRA